MIAVAQNQRQPGLNAHPRMGRLGQRGLQAAALKRLIVVLEQAATKATGEPVVVPQVWSEQSHLLARLYAAHAAYALASSPMRRSRINGWICRRTIAAEFRVQ